MRGEIVDMRYQDEETNLNAKSVERKNHDESTLVNGVGIILCATTS